jgi:hypothetical protein
MGAAYGVPLGGAVFSPEVMRGKLALRYVLPALVASMVATGVSWIWLPNRETYVIPARIFHHGLYSGLGAAGRAARRVRRGPLRPHGALGGPEQTDRLAKIVDARGGAWAPGRNGDLVSTDSGQREGRLAVVVFRRHCAAAGAEASGNRDVHAQRCARRTTPSLTAGALLGAVWDTPGLGGGRAARWDSSLCREPALCWPQPRKVPFPPSS